MKEKNLKLRIIGTILMKKMLSINFLNLLISKELKRRNFKKCSKRSEGRSK
jgi:hypothetical protein